MKPSTTRIITGLGIIVLGSALLLENLNIPTFNHLLADWWPLFIVGAGIVMLINNILGYIWAPLIVLAGVLLQLRELDLLAVSPWQLFWPLMLIVFGLSILMNRSRSNNRINKADRDDATAILGASDQKNVSEDYKGGTITAILGGVKIDLRKATIKDQATLDITSFWGGVELIVPRNLIIKKQTNAILGGIEDKTDQEVSKNSPTLYIRGDIVMASVEIKNT